VDLWEPAARTYQLNNPKTHVDIGDIRQDPVRESIRYQVSSCGGVQLVLGAIPCNWLSSYRRLVKAKAPELENGQATLDAALAIVKEISPAAWVLEDVTQIIGHLPIMTPYQILDAQRFCGQRRKRAYVGDFPPPRAPKSSPKVLGDYLRPGPYRIGRVASERKLAYRMDLKGKLAYRADSWRKAPTVCNLGSRRDAEMVIYDGTIRGHRRNMEWQEAAALQGFPQDYVFLGCPSDVCLMVADAVCVPVARAILAAIVAKFQRNRS